MNALSPSSRQAFDLPGSHLRTMTLQWHITERCNLKCVHCYQEQPTSDELSYGELCLIIEQFKALLQRQQEKNNASKIRGLINVTGGEPFLHRDFFDLLRVFAENRDYFDFGILTNGTLINDTVAHRLRELKPAFVQVSLEGNQNKNDAIRGSGTFDKITAALRYLTAQGIKTVVSFTAHRSNYQKFLDVARIACELGVTRVWADRLIPCGAGLSLSSQVLTTEETREFFGIMYHSYCESQKRFCNTEVFMGRALQFLVAGGEPYCCAAGDNLVALQPNGDLYPCRRMPICVGNVLETPLVDLYAQSDLFRMLRHHEIPSACESCAFSSKCRGGLKCLAYAIHGDPFLADPGCWRAVGKRTSN
ncbi:MAG: radical SAM protein [Desulfatiglandales bacterium]